MEQETENQDYRYPWLRTLFLLVLYAALLVFLWYFPTESGRQFFRTLFQVFLYIGTGLVLIGVTFLLFVFIMPVLPAPMVEDDEDLEEFPLDVFPLDVVEARALAVPALLEPASAVTVWDLLMEVSEESGDISIITVDEETGIVSVTAPDRSTAIRTVRSIRKRLQRAGLAVRKPRP